MKRSSRVMSNLIQQNVYIRDVVHSSDIRSTSPVGSISFVSVEEDVKENSHSFKDVKYPYPITPEYVSSFASSVDYKTNQSAMNANSGRVNLGDVSKVQEFLNLSDVDKIKLYQDLLRVFSKTPDASSDASPDASPDDNPNS